MNASNDLVKKLENSLNPIHAGPEKLESDDDEIETAMKYRYDTDSLDGDDEADSMHGIEDIRSSSGESCDSDYSIEMTCWVRSKETEHLSYGFKNTIFLVKLLLFINYNHLLKFI